MSRNSRLTADVSLEAHNLLRGYAEKHERSKGFLLEKMIRKFCGEVEEAPAAQVAVVKKETAKRFTPPKQFDVDEYMGDKGCLDQFAQAEKFCDFYESNGWKVGKNKMKCWKAAVRNWLKNNNGSQSKAQGKTSGNLSACEDFING